MCDIGHSVNIVIVYIRRKTRDDMDWTYIDWLLLIAAPLLTLFIIGYVDMDGME